MDTLAYLQIWTFLYEKLYNTEALYSYDFAD